MFKNPFTKVPPVVEVQLPTDQEYINMVNMVKEFYILEYKIERNNTPNEDAILLIEHLAAFFPVTAIDLLSHIKNILVPTENSGIRQRIDLLYINICLRFGMDKVRYWQSTYIDALSSTGVEDKAIDILKEIPHAFIYPVLGETYSQESYAGQSLN